jgi:CubicO group peptidase (beta-lactamase class C family)
MTLLRLATRGAVALGFVLAPTLLTPCRAQTETVKPLPERIAAIEKEIERKRVAYGIPGLALAIVRDDRVIFSKGFGLRDVAGKKPVTPETLFAIGSSTKAFTAMSAVMAQDDGKLSLGDSPKKYVPYFKLRDPDADAKITLRDMLCHRSGLARTDRFWASNRLSREEVIRVLADVKPTAKLGEKFQYQNAVYAAAGEAVARAEKNSYENLIRDRILKPLGMNATTLSIAAMQRSSDFALGYDANPKNPGSRPLPARAVPAVAPAGAINSSAADMAKWVRLMLGDGVFAGKRLVSETGMRELTKQQIALGPNVGYGLGWFLRDWRGNRVVEHGGNIDGFNAEVALIPEKKIGFVLLTNVSNSPLAQQSMDIVWSNLVDLPKEATEAPSATAADPSAEKAALEEIVGQYVPEKPIRVPQFEVAEREGKVSLIVPGQPAYPLTLKQKDVFRSPNLPDGFEARVRRDADGRFIGITWKQPGVELDLKKKADAAPYVAPITVDELLAKMVGALGGEAALRRHTSSVTASTVALETQGITARAETAAKAPDKTATRTVLYVLGKKNVGTIFEYFDGTNGRTVPDFAPAQRLEGDALAGARLRSRFHPVLDAKATFKTIAIVGKEKVGDEEAYVVKYTPEKADPITEYVSATTFLVLRRDQTVPLPTSAGGGGLPVSETFSDYRVVDGEKVPFRSV